MTLALGIDIAKKSFDAVLLDPTGKSIGYWHQPRTIDGLQELRDQLEALNVDFEQLHIGMEATGSLWKLVAVTCQSWNATCSVINPWVIHSFGQVKMAHHKNDKLDAALIARYVKMYEPRAWVAADATLSDLVELTRRVDDIKRLRTQEKCRLASEPSARVAESINTIIDCLQQEHDTLIAAIQELVAKDEQVSKTIERLTTIPGVAFWSACAILAELGDVDRFDNAKSVTSYAGLVAREFQSGTSVHKKSSLTIYGNRTLRKLLYFPAMAAIRLNPDFREFYDRLRGKGKSFKTALVACMNKLLRLFYAIAKGDSVFEANHQNKRAAASTI